ncbi:hypothetical protein Z517_07370 [Fonsecaea pedrosoi CBS 271.37]|uniref:Mid2 domain-containing protein n=1 Tax=Fonsecaea pedrosoi CBS 271.37 TaxID=1442368 RepID=A0A0D2H7V5_9EURO|nr:uncharacterized protein Z517_07370 [Fonsecaea pedrosoi CBS 271.37]KIW80754.1 hypothetical protein Z517_07370 [Fonsecaea pedrosoi CBS 271.37]
MRPHPDFTGIAVPVTSSSNLPSPTTDTSTTSASSAITGTVPATAPDMAPHATFLYPTAPLTLNNIDVIQVSYQAVWKSVNLSIFCEMSPGSDQFAMANVNLIEPSGTYAIAPVQAGMQLPRFPTYCNFLLCDSQNKTDSTTAAGFTMVSTQGIATTYALAATRAATTSASTTGGSSTASGAANMSSPSASAAAETAVSSTSHSAGLGSGAKAGIAIGVTLGTLALIAVIFFYLRMKRRMNKLENMVSLRSTVSSSVDLAPSEKAAVGNPTTASPTPVPLSSLSNNDGTGVAIFKTGDNHRNSEDWRRFFGNGKPQKPVTSS